MRVSREEKERSRRRIVAAATRRMRGSGIAGTSVAEVMADAELTHGGFYRHFASKEELLASALDEAFTELLLPLESVAGTGRHADALRKFVSRYLSAEHVAAPAYGCPLAALSTEIPREPPAVQAAFRAGLSRTIRALAGRSGGDAETQRDATLALLTQLVGAVVLARASNPSLAHDLLRVASASLADTTARH